MSRATGAVVAVLASASQPRYKAAVHQTVAHSATAVPQSRRPRWGAWLAVVAALLGLLVIGYSVFDAGLRSQQRREIAEKWELHTVQVMLEAQRLLSALQDVETGQRGYLLTGDREFLEPYELGRVAAAKQLDIVDRMTADNIDQQARLEGLRASVAGKLEHARAQFARIDAGDTAAALALARRGDGNNAMTVVRADVAAMLANEDALLIARRAATERANAAARNSFLLVLGFGALLLAGAVTAAVLALRAADRARTARADAAIADAVREQLEARVEARTRDLRLANDQVRQMQKMESLGQLTGGIAHDFNNMLAIIVGSLDLALRRLARGENDVQRYLDGAMDGAKRAATLTQRLLAFSRRQPLDPRVLDANALVAGMSELLRRSLGEAVQLETVLAGGLWRICADPGEIENAVLNLAVNARDAMPDGGKLTIETANVELDDRYAAEHAEVAAGQYVLIAVTDTGTGMPAAVIDRAFDPFFTTKPVGKGTGLGLSQVYGFVKQSQGHLKIYSETGRGTSVKVYLPRHFGDLPAAVPVAPPAAAARTGETVLVVEDDERVMLVTLAALRELGYVVLHAGSADEALGLLETRPGIVLLFTDIVMPGTNGRQLADAAVERWPELKVLFTTGYTRNAVVHDGTLDPGTAFLAKPFSVAQLAAKVRQVLDAG